MGDRFTVRCRGLPFSCTQEELRKFFGNRGIVHVDLPRKSDGRCEGEASVSFAKEEDYKAALRKDKQHMGHRYVDVFPDNGAAARVAPARPEQPRFRERDHPRDGPRGNSKPAYNGEGIVRLRGLPHGVHPNEVYDFFAGLPIVPNGVCLPNEKTSLKTNGECFVVFNDGPSADRALTRHMQHIQKRYIEVFPATFGDLLVFCERFEFRVPRGSGSLGGSGPVPLMTMGGGGPPPFESGPFDRPRAGGFGYDNQPTPGYGPPADFRDSRDPRPSDWRPSEYESFPRGPSAHVGGGDFGGPTYSTPRGFEREDPYGRDRPDPYSNATMRPNDPYMDDRRGGYPSASRESIPPRYDNAGPPRGSVINDQYGRPYPDGPTPGGPDDWRMTRGSDLGPMPGGGEPGYLSGAFGNTGPMQGGGYGNGGPRDQGPMRGEGGGRYGERDARPPTLGSGYGQGGWDGYGLPGGGGPGAGSDYGHSMGGGAMRRDERAWRGGVDRDAPYGRGGGQAYVLKMRGIPFRAEERDVMDFFDPIRPSRVEMLLEAGGRPAGEAQVEFSSRKDYDDALRKDKQYMGSRYIELMPDLQRVRY